VGLTTVKLLAVMVPVPAAKLQVNPVTMLVGVLNAVHVVSDVLKPLPVIVTPVVTGPELGMSVMVGPMTVKAAEAWSPVLPVIVNVYVPGVALPETVKPVPLN